MSGLPARTIAAGGSATPPPAPAHVVILEQDPLVRRRLRQLLTDQGYQVALAKTAERGIALMTQTPPALALLDWSLSGSGQLCRYLRQQCCYTYQICLQHQARVSDRIQGLDAGADEFLSKPILEAELLARVKAGIRTSQMQQTLVLQNQIIVAQNQTLAAELEEATQYIRSQLPPPMHTPLKIDFRFLPSQHLGGDCFDYFWHHSGSLVLYLLDVSGHGMSATLMAIGVLNELRHPPEQVDLLNPAEVLCTLNQRLPMENHHNKYLTIWYGVYQPQDRCLTYASAGHPPALLLKPSPVPVSAPSRSALAAVPDLECLKTPGLPVGLFQGQNYCNACQGVDSGDTLYLFSDGIYEFPDAQGNIWGLDQFQQLIQQQPLSLDRLLQQLRSRCAAPTFTDDLSLLRVRFG
ncbi:SpoIIE family protein phosphatase [Lyngbya confervoides]|uniref:SpoIIE family protein phosphatase n=1 Tax=Lyngbya confervoides BDU141951 TaxID=1574623 RepID=A0ABD4T3Z0_9CYAN|nr:SpoIIE family protein phosphatase [Lyngbya confervoides]MCM1983403.1 SpoIIE family protein phosphatase [Lyngbya confervoides BDU141951]